MLCVHTVSPNQTTSIDCTFEEIILLSAQALFCPIQAVFNDMYVESSLCDDHKSPVLPK